MQIKKSQIFIFLYIVRLRSLPPSFDVWKSSSGRLLLSTSQIYLPACVQIRFYDIPLKVISPGISISCPPGQMPKSELHKTIIIPTDLSLPQIFIILMYIRWSDASPPPSID